MTLSTRTDTGHSARGAGLDAAVASSRLEGQTMSAATAADAQQYVDGTLTIAEAIRRTQARYGIVV